MSNKQIVTMQSKNYKTLTRKSTLNKIMNKMKLAQTVKDRSAIQDSMFWAGKSLYAKFGGKALPQYRGMSSILLKDTGALHVTTSGGFETILKKVKKLITFRKSQLLGMKNSAGSCKKAARFLSSDFFIQQPTLTNIGNCAVSIHNTYESGVLGWALVRYVSSSRNAINRSTALGQAFKQIFVERKFSGKMEQTIIVIWNIMMLYLLMWMILADEGWLLRDAQWWYLVGQLVEFGIQSYKERGAKRRAVTYNTKSSSWLKIKSKRNTKSRSPLKTTNTREKIFNPDSGRMVLKNGAVGRRITGSQSRSKSAKAAPRSQSRT